MTSWRLWGLIAGAIVAFCGALLLSNGGGPIILILGIVMMITAAFEPVYGRPSRRPAGSTWRPTDERFIDPETGKLVTVWFDPDSGERSYVEETDAPPSGA